MLIATRTHLPGEKVTRRADPGGDEPDWHAVTAVGEADTAAGANWRRASQLNGGGND